MGGFNIGGMPLKSGSFIKGEVKITLKGRLEALILRLSDTDACIVIGDIEGVKSGGRYKDEYGEFNVKPKHILRIIETVNGQNELGINGRAEVIKRVYNYNNPEALDKILRYGAMIKSCFNRYVIYRIYGFDDKRNYEPESEYDEMDSPSERPGITTKPLKMDFVN